MFAAIWRPCPIPEVLSEKWKNLSLPISQFFSLFVTIHLRARVLRVWDRAPIGEPLQLYALQMVLVDVEV
jgi:hypothetical protein